MQAGWGKNSEELASWEMRPHRAAADAGEEEEADQQRDGAAVCEAKGEGMKLKLAHGACGTLLCWQPLRAALSKRVHRSAVRPGLPHSQRWSL